MTNLLGAVSIWRIQHPPDALHRQDVATRTEPEDVQMPASRIVQRVLAPAGFFAEHSQHRLADQFVDERTVGGMEAAAPDVAIQAL